MEEKFKEKMATLVSKNWSRVAFDRTYKFLREYKLRRVAEAATRQLNSTYQHKV